MRDIEEIFRDISLTYSLERKLPSNKGRSRAFLAEEGPESLKGLIGNGYKVYGSVGVGSKPEIPWVAILDPEISKSTQNGYYVVFLFNRSLDKVFLCLSLGYTQFEKEYGQKEAKLHIREVSDHYASLLKPSSSFRKGSIKLDANRGLGKGYEEGSILSHSFDMEKLNPGDLSSYVYEIMGYYEELKSIVGNSILDIEIDPDIYDERVKNFQREITRETSNPVTKEVIDNILSKIELKPRETRERLIKQVVRNRKIAAYIKQSADYVCSICGRQPFIQKNGKPYAEADHIIPLGHKTEGDDAPYNLRCLCAQCHAVITYGSQDEVDKLLGSNLNP